MKLFQKFSLPVIPREKLKSLCSLVDSIEEKLHRKEQCIADLKNLNDELITPVNNYDILSYYGSMDIETFVLLRMLPDPREYLNLPEAELLWLINQIILHLDDDLLQKHYSRIVERNLLSPEGTVLKYIFEEDVDDPTEILRLVMNKNTLYL